MAMTMTGEVTLPAERPKVWELLNDPEVLKSIVPLVGYTIKGEGEGGIAGFAKGGAKVSLADAPAGTLLHYDVEATVGGKIAQLGSRLIDGVAKNMADKFFASFAAAATGGVPPAGEAHSATPLNNDSEAAAEAAPKKSWLGRITG
jgi:carbon monoxide dehydrogenase subunit G